MKNSKGLIIVLSGFSGAGKGTIMKHLLDKYPGMYNLSISATTREPRAGEIDGREYFFKSREEFDQMVADNLLLEHATFNGNSYGTPKEYVDKLIDEGKDVLLEIECNGALSVKKMYPDAVLLFTTPPSAKELEQRLVGRGTEDQNAVHQRLAISVKESLNMPLYDYLIINDDINEAVERVHHIIQSEHYATKRNADNIKLVQEDLKIFERS